MRCCLVTGELGDYDSRIMGDSYVSEFRFIPDQVCDIYCDIILLCVNMHGYVHQLSDCTCLHP